MDLVSLIFGRRFSLAELAFFTLLALGVGVWTANNLAARSLQRHVYAEASYYSQIAALRTEIAQMPPDQRAVFETALARANDMRVPVPAPKPTAGLRLWVLGPDRAYLDHVRKAVAAMETGGTPSSTP